MRKILMGLMVLCFSVFAEEYSAGQLVPSIRCDDDYSYILRLPKNYDPAREEEWPVLFVMSPDGGKEKSLRPYIPGADLCGWILAMSVESKNGTVDSHEAITAMMDDVFDRLPVNEKRCYALGFSGGGREAFWMANKFRRNIIGIIPSGAGDAGNNYSCDALAYGLCGANCFNRWDMTITFVERIKKQGVLRFFEGEHAWAAEPLLTDAMLWLNGKYLEEDGSSDEINSFSRVLLDEALSRKEAAPEFAYRACSVLSEVKGVPVKKELTALRKDVKQDPAVVEMLAAQEDIQAFAEDNFTSSVSDCYNERTTKASEKDSAKLCEKYAGTRYEELMRRLGTESKSLR